MDTEQMEGSTVVYVVEHHTWIHHLRLRPQPYTLNPKPSTLNPEP